MDLSIAGQAAKPSGATVLTGARIVTMAERQGGVIENGVIVITGNRITAVGQPAQWPCPLARHDRSGRQDDHPGPDRRARARPARAMTTSSRTRTGAPSAHLALGVTTIFDPSSRPARSFVAEEMQRAGLILGPRIFSTGEIVYGARSRGTLNDIKEL